MNEHEFRTAPKETLLVGAKGCFENGKLLLTHGKNIGEKEAYGLACSLLVLSVEECVKCMILLAGFFNVNTPNNVSHFFRFHKAKHEQAAEMQSLLNSVHGALDLFKMFKGSENAPLNIGVITLNVLDKFLTPKPDFKKWWQEADKLKKEGFYVDYSKGDWQLPTSIDFETYERALHIAKPFVETLEVINQLRPEDYKINNTH